jgi:hypothetical protein
MKRFWALVLCALLAGCGSNCPDTAGNSASCGNPVKIAEMRTVEVNCPECTGAATPPVPFTIRFGKTLEIDLDTTSLALADSVWGRIYIYHASQDPVYHPIALDSLLLTFGANALFPGDLAKASAASPDSDATLFRFSFRLKLLARNKGVVFSEEALLPGLGVHWESREFIGSENNPLLEPRRKHYLNQLLGNFEGDIQSWEAFSDGADSGYVYVPGSPYFNVIDIKNGHFKLDSLPAAGRFELRFFVTPVIPRSDRRVHVYQLAAEPGAGPERPFRIQSISDSLILRE